MNFGGRRSRPFLDAAHVEDMMALAAVPHCVVLLDAITTHHALVRAC